MPDLDEVWNMSGTLRERMPLCADFVDACRSAFGQTEIDNSIKRGLRPDCEPELRAFFSEGGTSIGHPLDPATFTVSGDDLMPIRKDKP